MEDKELTLAGVDMKELMDRLMGNSRLVGMFIQKFLEDKNYANLVTAIQQDDMKGAESAAHTLKGMCGNLSIKPLYLLFQEQVRLLRAGEYDKAKELMGEITAVYEDAEKHLKLFLAQN